MFKNPEKLTDFLSKNTNSEEKARFDKVFSEIKTIIGEKNIEMPAIARCPDPEKGPWRMWWSNEKDHLSIDLEGKIGENEPGLYLFHRDKVKSESFGEESDVVTVGFGMKLLDFKYNRSKND